jgi:hypothetical protein
MIDQVHVSQNGLVLKAAGQRCPDQHQIDLGFENIARQSAWWFTFDLERCPLPILKSPSI